MKKIFDEFKAFISRGNVMDMAVGVIIGASFKAIVDSLVADIINPLLGLFGGMNFSDYKLKLIGDATLNYGNFITAIINFVIMAFVIFCIVKFMNGVSARFTKKKEEEAPAAPTTKVCTFCKSEIAIEATRCPHCTSELEIEE
ncbi:MAG: large conductance mechanosensitive channel protein MscL [Tyzzerella sp.]|nr:large conductance mechanosensitive channel protein MscL [Tyzzerella sp.]